MTLHSRRSRYLRGLCRHFGMISRDLDITKIAGADFHRPERVNVTISPDGESFDINTLIGASPALVGLE